MAQLQCLTISLNMSEIPENAIEPIGGQQSKLTNLLIESKRNLAIESGAFQNLNGLYAINFAGIKIDKIQNSTFKFNNHSNQRLNISSFYL